jgi:hypothetical protein
LKLANRSYLPAQGIYPYAGLNTLDPSPQADPRYSPNCLNMDVVKGVVGKRKGYSFLGATLTDPVIGTVEFEALDGTKTLLAFTTRGQFKYSQSSDAWTDITGGTLWTGDESDWLSYTITSGRDGAGDYDKWIIITNGKDTPQFWNGEDDFEDYVPTGISDFKTFRAISGFYDHLLIGNVTLTTGAVSKNVIYWTDTQQLLDFAGTNGGVAILPDIEGELLAFEPLGDRLTLYSDNSISMVTYIAGTLLYTFEKILGKTRLVSGRAIANLGPFHLYMSQENVILFDGSKNWRTVSDVIHPSYREELFANERYRAFAFHDSAKQHVYFALPTGPSTTKMYKVDYNLQDILSSTWVPLAFNDRPAVMGFYSRDSTLTYDAPILAGVKYSECNFTYNQGTVKGGFPVPVMGATSGRVAAVDGLLNADAGEEIEAFWDTVDFTVPTSYLSEYGRWIELEMELKGTEVEISYSTNGGQSYQVAAELELTSSWTKYKVNVDIMSPQLRLRFTNTCLNSTFYLRWNRLWLRPGGPA